MPVNNVTRTPAQRTMGPIESIASEIIERVVGPIGGEIIERVEPIAIRTLGSLAAPIVNKIETFSESHPRTIQTLEPAICGLIRFAYSHKLPMFFLAQIVLCGMLTPLIIPTELFLKYLALSEITTTLLIFPMVMPSVLFVFSIFGLSIMVCKKLLEKHLEQAGEINKLTETFLKLDPGFVNALNEWTRNESQEVDSQWSKARKNIIDFYNCAYSTTLHLEDLNLHSLPDIFDNPNFRNKLEQLSLHDNHLTRVPESIGSLQSLTSLKLAANPELAGLPSAILQLPSTCVVDISNCNFSANVLERIRQIVNNIHYAGPRISHSIVDSYSPFGERRLSIGQSLRYLYGIIGRNYNALPELNTVPNLREWLRKITWVADFGNSSKRAFVTKIIEYLERANEDPSFRDVFSATISDATESCGDRVALSVLNLGIAYKLSTIDLKNMRGLYHLLTRGVLALDLLQDIARQKIPTLQMVDEIEVYLGYPVKLKEALDLPIDIENMLYFQWSALSPQDLENAKNSVLNSLNNEDMQVAFLKVQPKWIDALNTNYPEEMERIAEDPNIAEEGLINLTRKIIKSFNS